MPDKRKQRDNKNKTAEKPRIRSVVIPFTNIRKSEALKFDPRYHILKAYAKSDVMGLDDLCGFIGEFLPSELVHAREVIEFKHYSPILGKLVELKVSTNPMKPTEIEYTAPPYGPTHRAYHDVLMGKTIEIRVDATNYYVAVVEKKSVNTAAPVLARERNRRP